MQIRYLIKVKNNTDTYFQKCFEIELLMTKDIPVRVR